MRIQQLLQQRGAGARKTDQENGIDGIARSRRDQRTAQSWHRCVQHRQQSVAVRQRGMCTGDLRKALGVTAAEGLHGGIDVAKGVAATPELQQQVAACHRIRIGALQQRFQTLPCMRVIVPASRQLRLQFQQQIGLVRIQGIAARR